MFIFVLFSLLSAQPRRYEKSVDLIKKCSNIVIVTIAKVSVFCGTPDFRSNAYLYLLDSKIMIDIFFR